MIQIDVEMPEKCSDCKFEYDPYGEYGIHWCYLQGVGGGETDAGRETGRLPSCPLIDVPDIYVGNSSEIPNSSTDCISRQAAIGAICSACGKIDCDQMDICEKLKLPSEQPEPCEDAVSDLIEGQAARRLNDLIFDINPAEICSQIRSDNLKNWCETIQTEMKMAMVQLPCWAERKTDG